MTKKAKILISHQILNCELKGDDHKNRFIDRELLWKYIRAMMASRGREADRVYKIK